MLFLFLVLIPDIHLDQLKFVKHLRISKLHSLLLNSLINMSNHLERAKEMTLRYRFIFRIKLGNAILQDIKGTSYTSYALEPLAPPL